MGSRGKERTCEMDAQTSIRDGYGVNMGVESLSRGPDEANDKSDRGVGCVDELKPDGGRREV